MGFNIHREVTIVNFLAIQVQTTCDLFSFSILFACAQFPFVESG